jgi:hypothetical protein
MPVLSVTICVDCDGEHLLFTASQGRPMKHQAMTMTAAEYRARVGTEAVTRSGHASDRYNAASRGRRSDLGDTYFRSKHEANYARYLEWLRNRGEIDAWEYEPETFWFEAIRRGIRSYTPDFKVWPVAGGTPYFVEVKSWMDPKSATKLKRMAKYHPDVRVDVFDRAAHTELAKKLGKVILGWES